MTDHFTCPDCGWPRGRVAQDLSDDYSFMVRAAKAASRPLAAPQGQECGHYYAQDGICIYCHRADAKEGEGTFPRISSAGLRGAKEVSKRQLGTTAKGGNALPMGLVAPDDTIAAQDGSEAVGVFLPGGGGSFPADRTNPSSFDLAHKGEYSLSTEKVNTPDIAGLVDRLRSIARNHQRRMEQAGAVSKVEDWAEWEAADALERMAAEMIAARIVNADAKEGEEDGSLAYRDNFEGVVKYDSSDAARAVRGVYAENVESLTPDIAGLVERLRDGIPHDSQDSNRLMDEAADALERCSKEHGWCDNENNWHNEESNAMPKVAMTEDERAVIELEDAARAAERGRYEFKVLKEAPDIAGLVERLRGLAETSIMHPSIYVEAADALERMANERAIEKVLWERHSKRLQAESDALVLAGSHWEDQSAEIARLRAALEKIPECVCDAHSIASAALTGREEG